MDCGLLLAEVRERWGWEEWLGVTILHQLVERTLLLCGQFSRLLLTAVLPLKLPKHKPVSKATILINGGMGLVHRLLLVLAIRVSTLDKCCKSPVITGALAVSIITDLRPSEQRGQRHVYTYTRTHTPRNVYLLVCESVYTCA